MSNKIGPLFKISLPENVDEQKNVSWTPTHTGGAQVGSRGCTTIPKPHDPIRLGSEQGVHSLGAGGARHPLTPLTLRGCLEDEVALGFFTVIRHF